MNRYDWPLIAMWTAYFTLYAVVIYFIAELL